MAGPSLVMARARFRPSVGSPSPPPCRFVSKGCSVSRLVVHWTLSVWLPILLDFQA